MKPLVVSGGPSQRKAKLHPSGAAEHGERILHSERAVPETPASRSRPSAGREHHLIPNLPPESRYDS